MRREMVEVSPMVNKKGAIAAQCHRTANRLRIALLAFCAAAVASFIVIYTVAPDIYVQTLMLTPDPADAHPLVTTLFMVAIIVFVSMLAVAIIRRRRWVFWLVLVAFTLSGLQVVAFPFELAGLVPPHIPAWYAVFRAATAVVQFAIGIWMIRIYRRCGVWGVGRGRVQSAV